MDEIASQDLRITDIPDPVDFQGILRFAHTYDGYQNFAGSAECGDFANKFSNQYHENKTLPEDLTDLRTCLFYEARRLRFVTMGGDESREIKDYMAALVTKIRDIVASRETSS